MADAFAGGMDSPCLNNDRQTGESSAAGRDPATTSDVDSGVSGFTFHTQERKRATVGALWGHARSVSGQSLHDFDDDDGLQGSSASERVSQLSQRAGLGSFNRRDSACHSSLQQSYSLPTPDLCETGLSHWPARFNDNELYVGTVGPLQLPRDHPVLSSTPQLEANLPEPLGSTQLYRSPSAGDLLAAILGKNWRLQATADEELVGMRMSPTQRVLLAYYFSRVPAAGERFIFVPEDGLQPIEYTRPKVKPLGRCNSCREDCGEDETTDSVLSAQIALIDAETAANLRIWSVAALCRSLSLDNVMSLLAALMLEKQVVFFSPNIGLLTAAVLSVIPILKPYVWQSLIMPVVPSTLLELLDAPVPFAVGLQHKTVEVAQKCADLVRINLYKDGIKNAPPASALPNCRRLHGALAPWHAKLQAFRAYTRRPVHFVTSGEEEASEGFLNVIGNYLHDLCGDIRRHTITEVGATGRVSVLLEESLVESFPAKDVPFMKTFVHTQMFSSYVDAFTA